MNSQHGLDDAAKARLLLLLLAFAWGLNWPVVRIALDEVSVWTLRALGYTMGAATMFAVIALQKRSAAIPPGRARWHVLAAGMINMIGFGLFGSFAQLSATTSRVIIVTYSMPIWSSLMAWLILRERLNARVIVGLALCIAGLATLVYPVAAVQSASGLLLALGGALCWGGGMIYMKWARIPGDLLAITGWQMAVGALAFAVGFMLFQGLPTPEPVSFKALLALLYNGVIGTGVAFILWFSIIEKLAAATASLGTLITPVIGVVSSMLVLSERPTVPDLIGFALIFAASACVLVPPRRRPAAPAVEPQA